MNNPVIELIIFKTKAGISDEALKEAAAKTTGVLQKMDGFLRREFSATDTGEQWADIVYWKDMNSAKQAAKAFLQEPDTQEFIAMIDQQKMTILHLNSISTTG